MEYKDYLQTDHWKSVRRKFYETHRECQHCGAKRGLDLHHKTYERVGHERLSDLRLLCRECHYRAHRMKGPFWTWHPDDVITRVWLWIYKSYRIEERE